MTRKPFRRRSKGPKTGKGPRRRSKSRRKGGGRSGRRRIKPGPSSSSHDGKGKSRDRPTSEFRGRRDGKGRQPFGKHADQEDEDYPDTSSHAQTGYGQMSQAYIQVPYPSASSVNIQSYFDTFQQSGWDLLGDDGTDGQYMCA